MLGHRGCRLGITYPEIYEMQARAILEAALAVEEARRRARAAGNHDPAGGLQVANWTSWRRASPAWRTAIEKERGKVPDYLIGTMIELPRAALRAGEIAADGAVLFLRHQ